MSRSATQLATQAALSGTEAGLVGLWEVNSTTTDVLSDKSSFRNHGTLGTTAQADSQDPTVVRSLFCPAPVATNRGAALQFDGFDDQLTVPNQAQLNLGTGDFTMEATVQTAAVNKLTILLSKRSGSADGFIFGIWSDGTLYAQLAGVPNHLTATGNLYDGRCHRVALTRLGATVTFYLDGMAAGTVSSTRDISSTENLLIGADKPSKISFEGQISEVRLWNVSRTAAQLAATTPLTGTEIGLVGLWQMSNTTGQTVPDRSRFANAALLGTSTQIETVDPVLLQNATCGAVLGTQAPTRSSLGQAYPNPFRGEFTLTPAGFAPEKMHIRIFDVQGRPQYEAEAVPANEPRKLGATLKPGLHLLQVTRNGQTETFWVVKLD